MPCQNITYKQFFIIYRLIFIETKCDLKIRKPNYKYFIINNNSLKWAFAC